MKQKSKGIFFTVTEQEKKKIKKSAAVCGLNTTEYLRQRTLGYAPQAVPPDVFFHFCEKIDALMEPPFSPEVNERAISLLAEIEETLLKPQKDIGKGGDLSGSPQSLLCGEKEHPRSDNPFDDSSANDMSRV